MFSKRLRRHHWLRLGLLYGAVRNFYANFLYGTIFGVENNVRKKLANKIFGVNNICARILKKFKRKKILTQKNSVKNF